MMLVNDSGALFLQGVKTCVSVISERKLNYINKKEVIDFLERCFAAIKSGGRIILQTPNAESPLGMSVRYGDFTHEVGFTPSALRRLLELIGFSNVEVREAGPVPFGCGMATSFRAFLWAIIRRGLAIWNVIECGGKGSGIYTRVFLISGTKP